MSEAHTLRGSSHMKPTTVIAQLSCSFAFALTPVGAQNAAKPADAAPIQLSVFEVSADKDLGYAASTTMSGTRTSEKLENLPNAISVMNADFLADLGLLNFLDAADFGVGTENIYNDNGTRGAAVGTRSGNQISFRGLSSARQLRDGFPWYMPQDAFNIERIEFSRGPGGLSYGDVDAGGTVNVSTKRAAFGRTSTTGASRGDSFGGRRASLDYQQTLLPRRLAFRLNGVFNDGESARQRGGSKIKGGAAALRWQLAPRTVVDVSFERANQRDGQTHSILTDQTAAYVRGTGTNDLDAIPALAGVQTDGVGQFRTQAAGNKQIWTLLDGRIYNLESTATAVFRNSRVQTGAAVANLVTNPALIPGASIPESIVPRYQDWAGPDNYADQRWHAYTVELRHDFTDRLRVLIAHNGQRDTVLVTKSLNDNLQTTFGGRGLFIDVTPNLPDPTDPAGLRLIPNPRYQQYYVQHQLLQMNSGHEIKNYRGVVVYDAALPLGITQRLIGSAGYRVEQYGKDVFDETFTAEEIARRGQTGNAAYFNNNQFYRYHYLTDGNSDAALRDPAIPGVTTFTRQDIINNNARYDQSLLNFAFNALGSFFKGRVRTSLGVSRDRFHQGTANTGSNPAAGNITAFLDASNQPIPEGGAIPTFDFTKQWVTNKSYGAVVNVLPWLALTGAWLESTQFTDNVGKDLNGQPLLGLRGEGYDFGVRFNFLAGRVTAAYVHFDTTSTNDGFGIGTVPRTELNPLLATPFFNNTDYRDDRSTGDEIELFFSPTSNWTGRLSYSSSSVTFTNFFPLLKVKLAEAQATAKARGLDPLAATAQTLQTMADTIDGVTATGRHTGNATLRYLFTEGALKGLALGGTGRYAEGRLRGAVNVGGTIVIPQQETKDEWEFGAFASYRRKFGRLQWTCQLNVKNVLDRVNLQGNRLYARYTPNPRQFILSNSFGF